MKVILKKDVARLGRRSEIKEVPDGHALNFLIPKGYAIIATPESLKRINEEVKKHGEQKESSLKSFEEAVKKLSEGTIVYKADANEKGNLFKGINSEDIAKHLQSQHIGITEEHIVLTHPIKSLGVHEVALVHSTAKGICRLEVVKK